MTDNYTIDISEDLPSIMLACLGDSRHRIDDHTLPVIDIRVWMQVWNESTCGLGETPGEPGRFIAPVVLIKYRSDLRLVYINGIFAYELKGRPAIPYYNVVMNRKIPSVRDYKSENLLG